jgi:hypothetical protein
MAHIFIQNILKKGRNKIKGTKWNAQNSNIVQNGAKT